MNDEVSVAELLEREGWTASGRRPKRRLPTLAVMLAVVVGCGLAAVLVHFGAQDPQADSPALLNVPHMPTGGLAGGGIPWETAPEVTGTETSIVVTNEAPPERSDSTTTKPSHTPSRHTETSTVTVTSDPQENGGVPTGPTTNSSNPGGEPSSQSPSAGATTTKPTTCLLLICW